jgi:hypothetical protein
MKIPIRTTKNNFHRKMLEVLKIFPPISNLRPKELDVLGEIMKQNEAYRTLSKSKRRMIILSKENKKEIQNRLKISPAFMNNILTTLRKYRLLTRENDLIPLLDIIPDNKFTVEIEFRTDASEDN